MHFEYTPKVIALRDELLKFMDDYVYPNEKRREDELAANARAGRPYAELPMMAGLKAKARERGLWNLFLPEAEHGPGLTNVEYAPLCEIMGRRYWCAEIFNCSAPDTGNMEVLARYGTKAQQERWLTPLLAGEIRSSFAMTEPEVASSDATNIRCSIRREGDEYVINGRKWYITGAMNERCEIFVLMGKTDPDNADRHKQQSMVLVPKNTPGVSIVRDMQLLGMYDPPFGHPEIVF
ncbi:acyl-CoA dehydrogenase family protein, partial [Variovorax sp. KBW07]|uniref:acyl-CoA dehydrogenase family protein n=1 Tax=Variovorax sp. KBW07 TaxID=2153358 RepID=UPI0021A9B84E